MAPSKKSTRKPASKKSTKKTAKKTAAVSKPKAVKVAKPPEKKVETPVTTTSTTVTSGAAKNRTGDKFLSALLAVGMIALFAWFAYDVLPNQILKENQDKVAEDRAAEERNNPTPTDPEVLAEEAEDLSFTDQRLTFSTNYGEIPVDMLDEIAPRNTENLIRLASRGYYDGLTFHRLLDAPGQDELSGATVIQGGDPRGDGTGGESAFGTDVEDEIYAVEPVIEANEEGVNSIVNTPEFVSDLYGELDTTRGVITYPQGLMIMANRGPNTNGSQFFFTIEDSVFPANYTIVGQLSEEGVTTLQAINEAVDPVDGDGTVVPDGKPSREVRIDEVTITDQQ